MPGVNGFSVGKDITVTVVIGGALVTFAGKTAHETRPLYVERNSHGIDGINKFLSIPSGWEGSIEVDRMDSSVDDFFAAAESSYYAGNGTPIGTIEQIIDNPDGSVSAFLFQRAVLTLREGGNWRADDKVTQRIDFRASQRMPL